MKKNNQISSRQSSAADRNWIKPPQTIIQPQPNSGTVTNLPQKVSYWIDRNGEAQLYTKDQLITCNILNNLNFILVKAMMLLDTLQTIDKNTPVSAVLSQDFAKYETSQNSLFNHFIQLLSATPDITFGEFLGFLAPENTPADFAAMGQKVRQQSNLNEQEQISVFYNSDLLKKSTEQ